MESSQIIKDHPAADDSAVSIPDFLLIPLVECAFSIIKKSEESDIPNNLRRISHFDSKAINNATARAQIISSLSTSINFRELVEEEFFSRVEVNVAFNQFNIYKAKEIVIEAASRNDLPLLASILWLKRPAHYEYVLGLIVATSEMSVIENQERESQRAEQTKFTHVQNALEREKSRSEILEKEVKQLEEELRSERQSKRVNQQRHEAQVSMLQKQIDSNGENVQRLNDVKDRAAARLEREASRANELEARLKLAQDDAKSKSEKISQLQGQLASALSSDIELNYEDLQSLILAQKTAEEISSTILKIMNKTRTILSNNSAASAPVQKREQEPTPKRKEVMVPSGLSLESEQGLKATLSQENLIVIIDGYNLSLNSFGDLPLEMQRDRTIACAANVESRFNATCVIIFDGESSTTRGRVQSKVHVVYSPLDVTADDVIIERIRVTPMQRPILLVTSDKNLSARAKGLGCQVVGTAAFVDISK
ncbi:MAG: NYN domain-containing protein [Acidimicrobiia bacterium]